MDTRRALVALNEEWRSLAMTATPGWAHREPALAAASDLASVLALIRERPDPVLAALLRLGAAGEELAYRVVLQTMLGKMVLLCSGRAALLPEAISELWLAIVEYPLARRPRAIAANLAWTVRRRLPRAEAVRPQPSVDAAAELPEPDASGTLGEARGLGLIDELTHRTLWAVYVAGLTSAQAAVALGTTPEVVRWRCSRALRRLAAHAELLAA